MRFERLHLIMFAASLFLALTYASIPVVAGWLPALNLGLHGLMFLILGHRSGVVAGKR